MMLRRLAIAALLALAPSLAHADSFAIVGPTPATSDNSKRLATTEWVNNFFATGMPLASGKIFIGSAGNVATAQTPSGDCTFSAAGVITCTQAAGNFTVIGNLSVGGAIIDANGILATNIAAPATPAAGTTRIYVDLTQKVLTFKNDAGTVGNAVVPSACSASQYGVSISAAGVFACQQPAIANISGWGTGVATALGVNVGSAGAPVLFNGAGGTPSSLVLTNATSLPTTSLTGTLQAAQEPAHTGDVTNSAGSLALTLATVTFAKGGTSDTGTSATTYTPVATCVGGGTLTAAVLTNAGRYKQLAGKFYWLKIDVVLTTIGSCVGPVNYTLPSGITGVVQGNQVIMGRESANTGKNMAGRLANSGTTIQANYYDNTSALSNGDEQLLQGIVETQ